MLNLSRDTGAYLFLGLGMALATLALCALFLGGCGPKFLPDCTKPGTDCPPCTGAEKWPDPCAAKGRDAGPEAGR
jgi:hypothetical protein